MDERKKPTHDEIRANLDKTLEAAGLTVTPEWFEVLAACIAAGYGPPEEADADRDDDE